MGLHTPRTYKKEADKNFIELMNIPQNVNLREWIDAKSLPLYKKWASSRDSNPDYSVYKHPDYVYDIYLCWREWTNGHVKHSLEVIKKKDENWNKYSYIDMYNGLGLSTLQMFEFGLKNVYYYNDNEDQVRMMHDFAKRYNMDISNLHRVEELNKKQFDVGLHFEVLEHYYEPMIEMKKFMDIINHYMTITFMFIRHNSIGHFENYLVDGNLETGKKVSKKVNKLIRSEFENWYTGFNGRPKIYKRKI